MTEIQTGVATEVAQGQVQSGTQEAVTPAAVAANQEIDPQARARKEQIDAATASLRREYDRIGLSVDEATLNTQVVAMVESKHPVKLVKTTVGEVAPGSQPYWSRGEYLGQPQFRFDELKGLSDLDPYSSSKDSGNLMPIALRRKVITALWRAAHTQSTISPPNCRGISVGSNGNSYYCEYDRASHVIRMTINGTSIDISRERKVATTQIAWVYDADMFDGVEKKAENWAHQQQLWEDACKYVGVFPEMAGYVANLNPESEDWELIDTSTGQGVSGAVELRDKEGASGKYIFLPVFEQPLLIPTNNEAKLIQLAQAIRDRSKNA